MSTSSLRDEFETVRKKLDILPQAFSEVSHLQYEKILERFFVRFTGKKDLSNYTFPDNQFSIEQKFSIQPKRFELLLKALDQNLAKKSRFYFIGIESTIRKTKFWLYEGNLESIIKIIENSYTFEFFILEKKMNWVIGEDHSGIIFGFGNDFPSGLVKKIEEIRIK